MVHHLSTQSGVSLLSRMDALREAAPPALRLTVLGFGRLRSTQRSVPEHPCPARQSFKQMG